MVTIKDVAKEAGVSITTVSRVMNKKGYLSKETIDKVHGAIQRLNYHPNHRAKAFSSKRTHIIGAIMPDVSHPFFGEMISHIEQYAFEKGYSIMVCNSDNNQEKEEKFLDMLQEKRMDGIISASHNLDISKYKEVKGPIICFDRYVNNVIPYVSSDNYTGGFIATNHLIDKGCENLLYISGPIKQDILSEQRMYGFINCCEANQIKYTTISRKDSQMKISSGYQFIEDYLEESISDFDGVFCSGDFMAHALYYYCKDKKIKVPDQLKIVGFDYDRVTRVALDPKLTTIAQPIKEISEALVNNLIKVIEDKGKTINLQLGVELILGKTT